MYRYLSACDALIPVYTGSTQQKTQPVIQELQTQDYNAWVASLKKKLEEMEYLAASDKSEYQTMIKEKYTKKTFYGALHTNTHNFYPLDLYV